MRTRALLVALALGALVACGDDDDGDGSAGSGASAGAGSSGSGGSGSSGKGGTGGVAGGGSAGRSGSGASGSGGSGTSGQGGSGNEDDAGVPGDGGMNEEFTGPILQRPTRDDYTCSVSKDLVNLKPRLWGSTGHAMASAGDEGAWLARIEWMGSDPSAPSGDSELLVSKIDASGAISGGLTVPVDDPTLAGYPSFVALDGGAHALIWVEGAENKVLRFATIDADGEIAIAPKTIVDSDLGDYPQPRAARATSGEIGLVWNGTGMNAFFASIGADGSNASDPVQFATHTAIAQPVIAPAPGGGFALLWKSKENSDFETPANVFFGRVDSDGAFQRGPVQLTDGDRGSFAAFATGDLAILPADYGYLLAWTEGSFGETDFTTGENSGGYNIVRLQRIDANGEALAPAADVRPMEDDIDEVEPTLIDFGDAVGLMWGRGAHIYICGGCVPNHSNELVLLDPVELRPVSNVVKVSPQAGGLLRRSAAVAGSNILTALDITFHVSSESGFAAFNCE